MLSCSKIESNCPELGQHICYSMGEEPQFHTILSHNAYEHAANVQAIVNNWRYTMFFGYNKRAPRIKGYFKVIVVDDNSPDGTNEIAKKLSQRYE